MLPYNQYGTLKPFSVKYNAGSSSVLSGNLANLLVASTTAAMNPGIRTVAPFGPSECIGGMSYGF